LGWPFALLTLAACLLPYVHMPLAVSALVAYFLVSASNASKIWIVRTIGERAHLAFVLDAARKSKLSHALLPFVLSKVFVALAGGTVLLFYPSDDEWGFWIGFGVLLYAGAAGFYGTLAMIRLFRRAAAPPAGGVGPLLVSPQGGA